MTLAIDGGAPLRDRPFPPWPQFDDGERKALTRALDQGQWWRAGGGEVEAFEEELAAHHGAKRALAVTNGTVALELALTILGAGPGDEVVLPAFTFVSTSVAIQLRGATPVPADVDLDTYCLDPDAAAAATNERTKVVLPVHMAGQIAAMDRLQEVASSASAAVLQDAAHAHGAEWRGKKVGDFGSVAILSFQNFKLMTAGEGGALLLPSDELWEEAFLCHNVGRPIGDTRYNHERLCTNMRMNEFSAAVLRVQLSRLDEQNRLREERAALLTKLLTEDSRIVIQGRDPGCDIHPHYMFMFRLDRSELPGVDRKRVSEALLAEGIPSSITYPPVYRTKAFQSGPSASTPEEMAQRCPNSETIGDDGIWIHHRVLLGDERDVHDVADAVTKVLDEIPRS